MTMDALAPVRTPAEGLPRAIAINLRRISIAEGIRAALATAVIVALNEWLQWPPIMEAALAALLTCLCDAGGPIRRRLPSIVTFGVVGALITAGFGLLRAAPLPVVIPLACACMFATSLARIYGQSAMQVGNLLTVVLVLALTRTIPDLAEAALLAGLFLAGSLWALLLTMVIWRLHPYLPARRAVAGVYAQLAGMAHDLRLVLKHPEPGDVVWDRHARAHHRMVRDAIEEAREAVLATVRVRGPITGRAAQSWIRLEAAEQIFAALIALSDRLAAAPEPATRIAVDRILRLLRVVLVLLGRYIVSDMPHRLARLGLAVAAMSNTLAALPDSALHHIVDIIIERVRIAITLAAPEEFVPGRAPGDKPVPMRERVLRPLRANLNRDSEALRHALRVAVVGVPAFAITLHWPGPYQHWLTIMLVLTMQPYFALTFTRALERIAGTVVGGMVAAALTVVCTTPLSIAVALFPLAVIALAVRGASFGLFITCITPLIVLLSELGRPGTSELAIAGMRALFTLIGGSFAVVGCMVLWPSWEPGRLARELCAAIAAHGRYGAAEISWLLGDATETIVQQARRASGVASNNVEASLQRVLMEPSRVDRARLEAALTIDAGLRRIAGRLSALQLDPQQHEHDRAAWLAWRDWILSVADRLAGGGSTLPPRPALPQADPHADALARIARQFELIAGALKRVRTES